VICDISPMAVYRLVCALGQQCLVRVLTRCDLPLPAYVLADEKHRHCLAEKVYRPTIVRGRVLWHLGYTEDASAAALTQSYQEFQCAASQQEPSYRVRGVLTDGFDSTTKRRRTLFPRVRLGKLPAPCDQQAPWATDSDRLPCASGLTLPVPHPVVPGASSQRLAGVCAGPEITPRCRPYRHEGWSRQRRTRTAMVSGQEGKLVCGP
jgi:hypothetical protein